LLLTVGLIGPSMEHRIVEQGRDSDAKTLSGFLCQSQIDTFDPTASRFATHCV